jgi:hypothetical protein
MRVAMQDSASIAANTTNTSLLSGQRYERCPFDIALGGLYVTGSALGLTAELNVGGNSVTPPTKVNAQNRFPVVPDDSLIEEWQAMNGQLIQLTGVNTTAGALTIFWRIVLVEAGVE